MGEGKEDGGEEGGRKRDLRIQGVLKREWDRGKNEQEFGFVRLLWIFKFSFVLIAGRVIAIVNYALRCRRTYRGPLQNQPW